MWLDPKLAQRCGQFGRSQALIDLRVELLDNRRGCSYWAEKTQPRVRVEPDLRVSAFNDCGNIGQVWSTSMPRKRERPSFPILDQRQNIAQRRKIDVDPSA